MSGKEKEEFSSKWKRRLHIRSRNTSPVPSTQQTPQVSTSSLPRLVASPLPPQDASTIPAMKDSKVISPAFETDNQPGKSSMAWSGVKTLLAVLESSSDAFGPLKSAVGGLNKCISIYEVCVSSVPRFNNLSPR